MAFMKKKADLNDAITNIKKQVGKNVRVVVSEINGFDGCRSLMYLTNLEGKLIDFKVDNDDIFESVLIVDCGSTPLVSASDSPIFQCGVALMLDNENKSIYENLDIINYEGNFRDKLEDAFDLDSFDIEKIAMGGE